MNVIKKKKMKKQIKMRLTFNQMSCKFLKILQYNVRKKKARVMISLLKSEKI